jgi:heme-degrading monooxygenase HmoA
MIIRIWHGWTTPKNADAYEALLKREVFKGIAAKSITGYEKIELLRRDLGAEVEFVTVMRFKSLDDVKAFVGEDYEQAYVPAEARKILKRFDERSQHYELREAIDYATRAA